MIKSANKYGDIVFFKVGNERIYLFNHPDLIRDVLVTNQKNFTKSRALVRAKRVLGEGLLTSEGEFHLRQRRLVQPAFHRDRIAAYGRSMVEYANRTRSRWTDTQSLDVLRLDGRNSDPCDHRPEMEVALSGKRSSRGRAEDHSASRWQPEHANRKPLINTVIT
jgi:hypothetical protein